MSELKEYERRIEEPVKPGPTPADLAAEEQKKLQEQLRERELETARAQAKAEAMERFVRESYANGRTQAPPPVDAIKAQDDLGLTEEDILNDPAGAISKISAQMRKNREEMADYANRVSSVVGTLAKSNFKAELQSVQGEQYGEWLTPYVEEYFRKNPEEAFKEGSVRRIYNELVGQNIAELQRLERDKVAVPNPRERVVEQSTRFSSSPETPVVSKSILSAEEEFFWEENNKRVPEQYRMSQEEWKEIRDGRKYPKKISTDIQVRGAKPNVSY